jgi:hypothetical protein
MIPGGVGFALSVTGSLQLLNDMIAKTPPTELRRLNREKLDNMEMDPTLTDLSIEKNFFRPATRPFFIAALEDMKHTKNRNELLKFALRTESEDLAAFRTRMAIMYAVYNRSVAPIKSFISLGTFPAGRRRTPWSSSRPWTTFSGQRTRMPSQRRSATGPRHSSA